MYAVFIAGTTNQKDTTYQVILIRHKDTNYALSRFTNGGRGESNAWSISNYDFVEVANSFVVGEVIATPLTEVDTNSLDKAERPNVLIQKMSKQWATLNTDVTTKSFAEVIAEIKTTMETDVSQLEKYRIDRRTSRDVSVTKKSEQVIQVVREPITREVGERNMNALVIPTKDQISWYIPRSFNGIDEFDIYEHARKTRKPILLEGHAGTGKTSSAVNFAYLKQVGVSIQSCSAGLQLSDMIGKTTILPSGEAGWIDGALTRAMRYGGVYVLDEIDFAQPKVLQRLQDVATNYVLELHENNGEVIHAHPDFVLVATYNNGYKHSNALNEAVLDRYKLKLYFDYDNNIESNVVKLPTLLKLANQMRDDAITGIYSTPVSLRMLKAFQELALDLNYDFAVNNFLMCFNADERPSVKLLLEAHSIQIQDEVNSLKKVGVK
jgi:nitric oxide reductase NorQ protein